MWTSVKCTDRHIDWSKEDLFPTERYGVSTRLPGRQLGGRQRQLSEAQVIHWLINSTLSDAPVHNRKQREAIAKRAAGIPCADKDSTQP